MNPEELKSKILNQFGDQLNEMGANIEIVQVDKLPSDKDLTKDKSIITYLGKVGKKFIWLSKNALGAIIIYVTIMSIPQAIESHKLHFPKNYELVAEIGKKLGDGSFFDLLSPKEPEGMVVYKTEWVADKYQYEQDRKSFNDGDINRVITSGTTTLSTSGSSIITNQNIISSSWAAVSGTTVKS